MADRYLLESGSPDGYLLEDGTGVLLLDTSVCWYANNSSADWTLSNSNLTANRGSTSAGFWAMLRANMPLTSGTFAVTVDAIGSGTFQCFIGFDTGAETQFPGQDGASNSVGYRNNGDIDAAGTALTTVATYTTGDIITCVKSGSTFTFKKNGVTVYGPTDLTATLGGGAPVFGAAYPAASNGNGTGLQLTLDPAGWGSSSGAITGTSSLSFSPTGTLTGTGALSGTSPLTFAPVATIQGLAPITGASSITFSPSGSLTGKGALSGTSSLTFAPSGTATGTGALTGTSALVFSPTGTLTGSGALTGASTLVFTPTATLTGKGALSGASTLIFSPSGVITGSGALSGTSSISFTTLGTLTDGGTTIGALTGSSSLGFSTSGTLSGYGALAGSTAITFAPAGTLGGIAYITGITSLTFTATGTLHGEGPYKFYRNPPLIGRRINAGRSR